MSHIDGTRKSYSSPYEITTEREENLLMKYSEQLERLESVLSSIDEILKLDRYE